MPDDYDDRSGLTPTVLTAIVAVSVFVAIILIMVLVLNNNRGSSSVQSSQGNSVQTAQGSASPAGSYPETEDLLTGSSLHPDDFDFWGMYPEPTPTAEPEPTEDPEESAEPDPSTDGKHTLIKYADGREEWVLISPYLPKHEYDFTKLVCQSGIMKYYENGRQVSYVGVDISKSQEYVNFDRVKRSGIDFVMLRVGARGYGTGQLILDEYFADNIKRATEAGLEVGVYFFSQAITKEEAIEEANMVIQNVWEYKLTYPVAYDMELIENDTARTDALTKSEKTDIAKAFLETISAAGYKTMIYGNKEWLIKEIDMSKLTAYDVWLSQAEDIPDYPYRFAIWQYSFDGSVEGIDGSADMNISFINYSEK